MKNKTLRKIQFGGWTKRRYKEVRVEINRFIDREEIGEWCNGRTSGFGPED